MKQKQLVVKINGLTSQTRGQRLYPKIARVANSVGTAYYLGFFMDYQSQNIYFNRNNFTQKQKYKGRKFGRG